MGRFKEEIMETVQTFEFTSFEHWGINEYEVMKQNMNQGYTLEQSRVAVD